jgi:hypothetical protein
MRKLASAFALIFLLLSCSKDKNSGSSGIIIKGRISTGTKNSSGTKSGDILALADAKKVFVATITNGMLLSDFVEITDGSFAATAEMGIATALVFLDETNKYIGTLSTRGLNLLPLSKLSSGENTSIDLTDLTLSETGVIPSHDPFGNEIIITDDEITRLKEIDGFFESLSKNIDADNDNIPDVLNEKQLFIKTRFWVQASHWGVNQSPLMSDIDMTNIGYQIELDGAAGFSKPNSITLSGPADSPYNDISTRFINSNGNGGFYAGISRDGGLFKKGTYSINIDGNNYTLDYSNSDVSQNQLFVLPTLNTDAQGKLKSITLEYKLPDGTSIDPVNILTDVMVQFTDDAQNQFYTTPWLKNDGASLDHCTCVNGVFSYTLETPLDISHLDNITIPYNDLLGNTYFISWRK